MLRIILVAIPFMAIFIVTLLTALSLLSGQNFGLVSVAAVPNPTPTRDATATAVAQPLFTPVAGTMTTLRNVPLGFEMAYPINWRLRDWGLHTVLSPSPESLERHNLRDTSLWVGIPPHSTYHPEIIMQEALDTIPGAYRMDNIGSRHISGQPWTYAELTFESRAFGGEGRAIAAVTQHNDVGYMLVAIAPSDQWATVGPIIQGMVDSFQFTQNVVIRPTDATPPPTLTPTPTPVIYVVVPGDSMGAISARFGVTIEAIQDRNGMDDTFILAGQTLIIPVGRD